MNTMKTALLLLATATLSGCAVYPAAPVYESYPAVPYGVVPPTYIYGGAVYPYGSYRAYPRGDHRQPRAVPHPGHGADEHIHRRLREGPRFPHDRW
ncbi:hypothetical protein [Polaromonas sp.]|uniref:hypothetical protein n=1 Tax=Polaromonas sp. TaxID=1869339 RepID=UPI003CB288DF